jgi:hypothetical protein
MATTKKPVDAEEIEETPATTTAKKPVAKGKPKKEETKKRGFFKKIGDGIGKCTNALKENWKPILGGIATGAAATLATEYGISKAQERRNARNQMLMQDQQDPMDPTI